ncbi:MAG: acyl-CoA/acyl-ACP dehydrogenase, partial [Chloroflexi bacterium]|nr:acyl-CoA/acyl-ACP dehydrogenase [Chloroflexota bacterium]
GHDGPIPGRLFATRNHAMYAAKQEMTFQGSQNSLWGKETGLRVADRMRDVLGPYALLDDHERAAPEKGDMEMFQRSSLGRIHPGGTIEVQKVIMARRIGVSRTRERAAPTPSTAGQSRT